MILTAIIPLIGVELTKKLSGRLLSSSGEVVKKEALTKSRLFVNKISKRLIKKEIFKKKISELKPDELKGIMENIFSTLGEEFNSSIGDLVQDVTDANNIIIEAIKNVEQQISQIDDFGNYVINSLKKEIRNGYISKDEFKEIFQTSVGDWFFDLEESIERLGSEQIERIKETISLELIVFQQNFALISGKIDDLADLIEEGVRMNEDQYNFLIATFQKRFGEEDITHLSYSRCRLHT